MDNLGVDDLWRLAFVLAAIYLGLALFLRSRAPVPSDPPRPISPQQRAEVLALLQRGEEVAAVRRYREYSGASLLAAKRYVDVLSETEGKTVRKTGDPS
ncbi:hypothetical protein [Deinococcus sp. Marseille-Q6407]|uniref:hypothetical protein n=1 Tax=Deinococcus sp. Marseille-Q6407 TaxID=2969223 RepID=UPI0021BFA18F|nr:hypothetical protein [Deinococcus sp. Marseille-Q6407]